MKLIQDLAREAGLYAHKEVQPELQRFAELVIAQYREGLLAVLRERKQHCACIYVGGVNTEQCKLHGAWCDTLNEQADYRRERDALQAEVERVTKELVASEAVNKAAALEIVSLRTELAAPTAEPVNQQLLEALKSVTAWMDAPGDSAFSDAQLAEARAAIAAAEQAQGAKT